MAKEVKAKVKLQLPGGGANPGIVGSILGQHGVNLMDFCKKFNEKSADKKGQTVPCDLTVYKDRTFDITIKTPLVSELIRKKANVPKGSSRPHEQKVGKLTWNDVEEIAKIKLPDLNAHDIEQAKKIVAGSARSMGIDVVD